MPLLRSFQRHLVPGWVATLYFLIRSRSLVSTKANVQVSPRITLGKGTKVKSFAVIQTSGGGVNIGCNCAVNNFVQIATIDGNVEIGDWVRIGPNAVILGSDRNFKRKDMLICEQGYENKGIVIEDDVLVGAGAVIMAGVRIGRGAVIGAGSLVNKNVPDYCIVGGIPARTLGERV